MNAYKIAGQIVFIGVVAILLLVCLVGYILTEPRYLDYAAVLAGAAVMGMLISLFVRFKSRLDRFKRLVATASLTLCCVAAAAFALDIYGHNVWPVSFWTFYALEATGAVYVGMIGGFVSIVCPPHVVK